jgi:hypothetical protein
MLVHKEECFGQEIEHLFGALLVIFSCQFPFLKRVPVGRNFGYPTIERIIAPA